MDKKNNALIIVDVQKAFDDKNGGTKQFLAPRGYTIAQKERGLCVKV